MLIEGLQLNKSLLASILQEKTNDMKIYSLPLLSLLFAVLFITPLSAQVGSIEQTTVEYEKQSVAALTVTMKPERKEVQKAFDDWMKDRYDINMKGNGLFGNKNMENAEAVMIPAISPENITIFAETEKVGDKTRMALFASRGLGNFIEANDYAAFAGLEKVFDAFLSSYLPEYYEERVAEAREKLEDLRDDFSDAEKDFSKNEEKIRELRVENEELRGEMDKLRQEIKAAEATLVQREDTRKDVRRTVTKNRD